MSLRRSARGITLVRGVSRACLSYSLWVSCLALPWAATKRPPVKP